MKTDLFQSCGHCWVFQICWHIECSTLTASSFRIWNTSTGILSLPLALFVVMLLRPTGLHIPECLAQVSDHTIVIIWVVKTFFVQFFCVFLPPPLSIFCFCLVHAISVLYRAHLCMKCSLGISNFLEELSSLSHSIVSLYFFALITEEGLLISPWPGSWLWLGSWTLYCQIQTEIEESGENQ